MEQIDLNAPPCRRFARMIAGLAIALVATGIPARKVHSGEPDTAQRLLFDDPYLASISPPAKLAYRFEHATVDETNYGKTFADDIQIEIDPPDERHELNAVTLNIFTESRNRRIGPLSDVRGNPVIMVFLERDVFQMKRRVPGSPAFFRNTIRKAMRENANIQNVDIKFDGESVAAKRVTITPFDDDNNPQQFSEFRKKTYHFTVSEAVPGGVFEIVSLLPDPNDRDKPLVFDRMFLTSKSDER